MNFIQNTNKLISILYQIYTELSFGSNYPLLIYKPPFFHATFSNLPKFSDSYSLYWVHSDIHVTPIAFLDWLTSSWIVNEFLNIGRGFGVTEVLGSISIWNSVVSLPVAK